MNVAPVSNTVFCATSNYTKLINRKPLQTTTNPLKPLLGPIEEESKSLAHKSKIPIQPIKFSVMRTDSVKMVPVLLARPIATHRNISEELNKIYSGVSPNALLGLLASHFDKDLDKNKTQKNINDKV